MQTLAFGPSPLAESGICVHTGRFPNSVRFLVLELGQRQKLAEEAE
jgi:hypothetical protein